MSDENVERICAANREKMEANAEVRKIEFLKEHAYKTMDPVELATIELDAQAQLMAINMAFQEYMENEEI